MFPLNTILAWNINIIMNKKYDNNNIIIASRAYFLQFGDGFALPSGAGGVFITWREVSTLPMGSYHAGASAGAPAVYLGARGHRHEFGPTGGAPIFPRAKKQCQPTVGRRFGSAGGDALNLVCRQREALWRQVNDTVSHTTLRHVHLSHMTQKLD
jgi:hypothetical protein